MIENGKRTVVGMMLEKDAAKKAMSRCLLLIEEKVASVETEKKFLSKLIAELLASARWKGAKSAHTRKVLFKTILPMKSEIALHLGKTNVPYCCKKVSEPHFSTSKLQ